MLLQALINGVSSMICLAFSIIWFCKSMNLILLVQKSQDFVLHLQYQIYQNKNKEAKMGFNGKFTYSKLSIGNILSMRHFTILCGCLAGILTIAFISCKKEKPENRAIIEAQNILRVNKDSASKILEDILADSNIPVIDRLWIDLLKYQVKDPNLIYAKDTILAFSLDSVLCNEIPTYNDALSLYHNGRVYYNISRYTKSLECLLQASKMALEDGDNLLSGLSDITISDLYGLLHNPDMKIRYSESAIKKFEKQGGYPYIMRARLCLGNGYLNKNMIDTALFIYTQVAAEALHVKDTSAYMDALRLTAEAMFNQKKYNDVIAFIRCIETVTQNEYTSPDLAYLSESYAALGMIDSAEYYNSWLLQKDSLFRHPSYVINRRKGDWPRALESLEVEYDYLQGRVSNIANNNLTEALTHYYNRLKDDELKNERQKVWIYIGVALAIGLTLIVSIVILNLRRKREAAESDRRLLLMENLKEELSVKESEVGKLENHFLKTYESVLSNIEKLGFHLQECSQYPHEQQEILEKMNILVRNISSDEDSLLDMAMLADERCNGIVSDFKTEFPKLRKQDYLLFLYSVCGFSIKSICLFLDDSSNSVYIRKSRLRKKITSSQAARKDDFLAVLD